jgi:membrane-associated phospholipid phosphatase
VSETPTPAPPPPEERLAQRLAASPTPRRAALARALEELADVDRAIYRAVADTPMPTLDEPLRRLSQLANNSGLWLAIAGGLFVVGGAKGRRAALIGVAAIGVNSAIVNLPMKVASGRQRPDREGAGVPSERWVRMPASTSFPSGHSSSAFAFASAVGSELPALAVPLRALAAAVAYSRVHTGVHYPGDVVVGSMVGTTIGEVTTRIARVVRRRRAA